MAQGERVLLTKPEFYPYSCRKTEPIPVNGSLPPHVYHGTCTCMNIHIQINKYD